jgi:hypothetical protein
MDALLGLESGALFWLLRPNASLWLGENITAELPATKKKKFKRK